MATNDRGVLARLRAGVRRIRVRIGRRVLATASRSYSQHLGAPIISITGTNGKTTVTRLLDRILREAGYRVGMACSDGVARDGEWIASGDQAGIEGLALAMKGGGVDALVAETARGGILRRGFGFRRCRVAVVTNVADDHLGLDGVDSVDEMAEVKARVVDRVAPDGVAVLNADDPRVAAMAQRVPGRAIFFSLQRPPREIRRCVFLEDGRIRRRSEAGEAEVMAARALALTRGGLLRYNLANALAVLAALDGMRRVLPVPDAVAVRVLASWLPGPEERPFSFQLLEFAGDHILLSHSKNPVTYAEEMASVRVLRRDLGYETIVGFITHVGNRSAEFHRSIAESAASVCDQLMVVAPPRSYLRGRSRESLIAALEAGVPPEKRLSSRDGSCAELVAALRDDYPGKTLYAFFPTRQHRGATEIRRDGREIGLDLPAPDAPGPA